MCFLPRISEIFRKERRKGFADSRSLLLFMTWFSPGTKGSSSKERGGGHVAISATSRRPKPPSLDPFWTNIEWPCQGFCTFGQSCLNTRWNPRILQDIWFWSTKYVFWMFKVGIYPVCYLGLFIAFKILDSWDGCDWFLPKLAPQVLLHLDSSWVLIILVSPVRNQPGICFFCSLGWKKTWDAPPGIESHWNTVTAITTCQRTSRCFRGLLQVSSRRCRWSRRASHGRMVFRLHLEQPSKFI